MRGMVLLKARALSMMFRAGYRGSMGENATQNDHSHRASILAAAARLIARDGMSAATTRAVATAAGVQAPTLYRIFGDKDGLFEAVAEATMSSYLSGKEKEKAPESLDPIEALRAGWDRHVEFGLQNSGVFAFLATRSAEGVASAAVLNGLALLRERILSLAREGRLVLPVERAVNLVNAAATGVVLTLLRQHPDERDIALSHESREAVLATITGQPVEAAATGAKGAAITLRSQLDGLSAHLSAGEKLLLAELLDRIVDYN